jgi:hypothetical protein
MQVAIYEASLLVEASFRLSKSDDIDEILAVGCVIRNWIERDNVYRTYPEAISHFMSAYETRALPDSSCPALVDPSQGMLQKIEDVYFNRHPDITSAHDHPGGARYFARAASEPEGSWLRTEIIQHPEKHPLLGTWGAQQFYA